MTYKGFSQLRRSNITQSRVLTPRARRLRMWGIFGVALVWCGILCARLYSLQIANFETWQEWALKQHFFELQLASERGPIHDREGKLMAVSVPAGSVYVRPKQVKDRSATIKQLSEVLSIPKSQVEKALSENKPFVWVERQIPRAVADKAVALKLPGVGSMLEARRFYPYNQGASSLIGKVGVDGVGLSGVEAVYEKYLRGEQVKTRVVRDAFGNVIDLTASKSDQSDLTKGNSLQLTIDADLQMIVDEELEAGRVSANAKSAMAVMIDAVTGEILAMSQAPMVNFNKSALNPKRDLKNAIVETVFEPGSIFKPIVAAAAIELGLAKPEEIIDCEHGRYPFGPHVIKDVHPYDRISFHDVVVRSSNIGMTKIGVRLGSDRLYEYLKKFGFGEASLKLLPGETRGILRPVEAWARVDVATHSFGQGVAVTPLQVVRAVAAIANGGSLPTLRVIADDKEYPVKRVISESTASKVREMMYGVVTDEHGTGKKAYIGGVQIGGKTGTAQKARSDGRGYKAGAYMASFVGFADASPIGVPKTLALIVIVDEPNAPSIYGGVLAAPVFQRIMRRSLQYLTTKAGIESDFESSPELMTRASNDLLLKASFTK